MAEEAKWYVVHTYSGYENKVADSIVNAVENRQLHDFIYEVKVPTEMVTEIKDNQTREVERKLFPSYVLVKMIMTDDSWYVVRNIRGVTGFVGPGRDRPFWGGDPQGRGQLCRGGQCNGLRRLYGRIHRRGGFHRYREKHCLRHRLHDGQGSAGGAGAYPGTAPGLTVCRHRTPCFPPWGGRICGRGRHSPIRVHQNFPAHRLDGL